MVIFFLHIFNFKFLCFGVAMSDLLHDVVTIHDNLLNCKWAVPPQKMARELKFRVYFGLRSRDCTMLCSENKGDDQLRGWIRSAPLFFAHAKSRFSYDDAHFAEFKDSFDCMKTSSKSKPLQDCYDKIEKDIQEKDIPPKMIICR